MEREKRLNARAGMEVKPEPSEHTPEDILCEALEFQTTLKREGIIR